MFRHLSISTPIPLIEGWVPAFVWIKGYSRELFSQDLIAGIIVAVMLVPQSMAYALLAGLPPEVGLYASILPLMLYGLLGTSRCLAVGPVAIVSLLVAEALGPIAGGDISYFILLALTLALLTGLIQLLMGLLKVGFIVNFLSHPVLSAFTTAAAILIGFSQLKHLLGYSVPGTAPFYEQIFMTGSNLGQTNGAALLIGLIAIAILMLFKRSINPFLQRLGLRKIWATSISKAGPLVIVVVGSLFLFFSRWDLSAGINIVGQVPSGLPSFTLPFLDLSTLQALLPAAIAISLVGYMESVSVAKSLASKRREKIDPNQELIALGAANIGAAFTGGYPVTGGISRSVVNFSAGARTGMASIITALLITLTVLFLTPLFYFLPNAVLAAIILVAVFNMIDFRTLIGLWTYNKQDGIAWMITFIAVLSVGVEVGILYGIGASLALYIWRTSQPHIAVVGQVEGSELYRNVVRHQVTTWPQVIIIRVDGCLYFANTRVLDDMVFGLVANNREVSQLVLIGSGINFIDASALEALEALYHQLKDAQVELYLAAFHGPVLDQLKRSKFYETLGEERIFLSTHVAMQMLGHV
ncbi:MAG: sulfate permease [Chloroflexota bacterium]